jgi:hypothetical protein
VGKPLQVQVLSSAHILFIFKKEDNVNQSIVLRLSNPVYSYDTLVNGQLEESVEKLLTQDDNALKVHYLFPQRTRVVNATDYVKRKISEEGFIGHLKNIQVYQLSEEYAVRRRHARGANGNQHQVKVYVHKIEMLSSVYGEAGAAFALLTCDLVKMTQSIVAWVHVEVFVDDSAIPLLKARTRQSFFQWRVEINRQLSQPLNGGLTSL